ncbi:MAG: hypothetical protein Q9209_005854 [Squamulea sp. 1 TL-2023]
MPSTSTAFDASYQNPVVTDTANEGQPSNDVSIMNHEIEPQPRPIIPGAVQVARSSHRARSGHLDWNTYKETIKELYINQNKSLPETMDAMNKQYSFDASQQLYKKKFTEWKWQKNLSVDTALRMAEIAKRRKREEGKDTVFTYRGRVWESDRIENTLLRTKKPKVAIDLTDVPTPEGLTYKTPEALVESPANNVAEDPDIEGADIQDDGYEDISDDATEVDVCHGENLALRWQGHSRTDLQELWRTALQSRDTGNHDEAESLLSQASTGLRHVMGKTDADTVKATYNLADLNARSGRMEKADDLIEKVIQDHLETYGCRDARTQKSILHAVELLNGWNREADAVGLVSRFGALSESLSGARKTAKARRRASKKGKAEQKPITYGPQADPSRVTQSLLEDLSHTSVDCGLSVARTHIAAKNRATEELLLAMISQCKEVPALSVQHMKALAELLDLYGKLDQAMDHEAKFRNALNHLQSTLETYDWREDPIESFDLMEAALQLVANALKSGFHAEARALFDVASSISIAVFGWDERTVWVNITIGLAYQTHMTWDDAAEWFYQAFTAAFAGKAWGPKDGIVRSLQKAFELQHFSSVSDEGRPFKSISGVCIGSKT